MFSRKSFFPQLTDFRIQTERHAMRIKVSGYVILNEWSKTQDPSEIPMPLQRKN